MKLNNKGFAITAVLYGLLILFVILVSAYLLVLSAKKDRVDNLVTEIESEYNSGETSNVNLKEYITNLYNNTTKKEITHDGIVYNQAQDYRLINDRLGGTSAINDGNIRYYGSESEELKNYIYFNCSDYSDTSTCEKWRIIGIVDGKVKIMRGFKLEGVSEFDESTNVWDDSTIERMLNSGTFNTGLQTTNSKTLELISPSTWYLNASNNSTVYANSIYVTERGGTTWNGNIAILYPSDYGYAVDLNVCKSYLDFYESEDCTSTNWMKNIVTNNGNNSCFLITPTNNTADQTWYISYDGNVGWSSGILYTRAVIPTLYLDTTLIIDPNTDGSSDNPFKLIVSE